MKAISAYPVRSLNQKSKLVCADNSGAKEVKIISVFRHHGRKRMSPSAGIGEMVKVVVKKGKPEIRKKVETAVIIRVKKEYRRPSGLRIKFEDNAVVLVDEKGVPKGSEIKGVVAKEAGERFPKIAGLASQLVWKVFKWKKQLNLENKEKGFTIFPNTKEKKEWLQSFQKN